MNSPAHTLPAIIPWETIAPPRDLGFGNTGALEDTEKFIVLTIEILIIVSILVGNILVITAVAVSRRLKTITNCFIVSLAISDLMVGIIFLVTVVTSFYPELFDVVLACLVPFCFLFFTCIASVLNMLAIAIDRFVAISWPILYIRVMNRSKAAISIALAWTISLGLSVITLFWNNTVQELGILSTFGPDEHCDWNEIFVGGKSSITLVTCIGILLPMVICSALYIRMFLVGKKSIQGSLAAKYLAKEQRKRVREKKLTMTLGIIVGAFAVCWLPYIVLVNVELWCECNIDPMLRLGLGCLCFVNSSINPILYALRTEDFRYAYVKIFRTCLKEKFENRGSRSSSLSNSKKTGDSFILSSQKNNYSQSRGPPQAEGDRSTENNNVANIEETAEADQSWGNNGIVNIGLALDETTRRDAGIQTDE